MLTEPKNSLTILLVDDDDDCRMLVRDAIAECKISNSVFEARNGQEALDMLKRVKSEGMPRPGLIYLDIEMPGLDGQHFYKSLARAGNPLRERFLFVTGDIVAVHTREFLERNELPYVSKPFRVEELTGKVYRVLESKVRREAPAPVALRKNAARNG